MGKALVIIDVQKGMWAFPDFPPHDGDGVLQRIAALIDKARAAGAPVMYVQHNGVDEPNHPFRPGLPGYPFHDAIA
ncbi:MAG TPA: isochorismatase family protein, partial [Rhizomicrobium sp.]|nr:isochorismatase family protein [Rhizomicrobium sp.]